MVTWIKNAVFYQIYPTSFYDGNGDGIGDLKGIAQKVEYIKSLGVDAVWLNPIFRSPFKDGGYDISDYYEIDKKFGDMADLENLIRALKSEGIKVVLDLVIGHTSISHPWFKKSAQKGRNPYSDYYIWSNSVFDECDGKLIKGLYNREAGYYINYYASQPALNFGFNERDEKAPWKTYYTDERLRPLREDILSMMRFYLDKGVDGFRVDMASSLIKGCVWNSDNPKDTEGLRWLWKEILGTLRKEYADKVYIAEWVYPKNSVAGCGFDLDFFTHDTPSFNALYRNEKGGNLLPELEQGDNYFSENGKGSIAPFVQYIEELYPLLEGKGSFSSPSGSHDEIRMATGKSWALVNTIFCFLLTYKHIPFVYYGDEIGLEHNYRVSKDGGGIRTGARTPMQWTNGVKRGFSSCSRTYLPVNKKIEQSVESQEKQENSILNTVRKLIAIRKAHPCLWTDGAQEFLETDYPVVYERRNEREAIRVYINPSNESYTKTLAEGEILFSQNTRWQEDKLSLGAQSFAIVKKRLS